MNNRILPFLEYQKAMDEQDKLEDSLSNFLQIMCPDGFAGAIESPFQKAMLAQLQRNDPDLFDWYTWYVWECNDGNMPCDFAIDGSEYNVADFETLEEFLTLIAKHYPHA